MMDNRYRDELDQIRLTGESKRALVRALAARQVSKHARRWSRTAVAAAVIAAVLAGTGMYRVLPGQAVAVAAEPPATSSRPRLAGAAISPRTAE